MFRAVALPQDIAGRLYLHSMPGREEPFSAAERLLRTFQIDRIVCLTPQEEIRRTSPAYARAIAAGDLPCPLDHFPIADFGVPEDRAGLSDLVGRTARRLLAGERILIHCGAGRGRTGTVACCVLIALGMPVSGAVEAVRAADAGPESPAQRDLVNTFDRTGAWDQRGAEDQHGPGDRRGAEDQHRTGNQHGPGDQHGA